MSDVIPLNLITIVLTFISGFSFGVAFGIYIHKKGSEE